MSGYKPKERVYGVTWTNATYWHRATAARPAHFAESEWRAWLTSLHRSSELALRLRRVIEQPAPAGEGG